MPKKKPSAVGLAFAFAEAEFGRKPKGRKSNIPASLFSARKQAKNDKALKWEEHEDEFLRKNLGKMTDAEIGEKLGRSEIAVHLRWSRDLHLTSPSKDPNYITANQASEMLGLDAHKITHWCDIGFIPHFIMAGGRKIRLIPRVSFFRWVISTSNWIYFDWKKIPDQHLRRLCELRAARWGDEWWTTSKAARYIHKDMRAKDLKAVIKRGAIPAVRLEHSRGGRHNDRVWSFWFIKRSDVKQFTYKFGRGRQGWKPTPRAVEWIKKARAMGLSHDEITRSMGSPVGEETVRKFIVEKLGL